jgi:hypothetical protein
MKLVRVFLKAQNFKENVNWISKEQPNADHDFKYKDRKNKWWFVEVKTLSNGVFYISKNE